MPIPSIGNQITYFIASVKPLAENHRLGCDLSHARQSWGRSGPAARQPTLVEQPLEGRAQGGPKVLPRLHAGVAAKDPARDHASGDGLPLPMCAPLSGWLESNVESITLRVARLARGDVKMNTMPGGRADERSFVIQVQDR